MNHIIEIDDIFKSTYLHFFRFVHSAVSSDKNRYILNKIFCSEHNGKPVLVATDGRRLHMIIVPEPFRTIFLKGHFYDFKFYATEITIKDRGDEQAIGNYPKFTQIIPKLNSQDAKAVFRGRRNKKGVLEISETESHLKNAITTLSAAVQKPLLFNSALVHDAAKMGEGYLYFTQEGGPIVIVYTEALAVLMPLRESYDASPNNILHEDSMPLGAWIKEPVQGKNPKSAKKRGKGKK